MTTWWSTEKINSTISQEYVERELGTLKNREALHRVLKFGDGLTNDTYLDYILDKCPRFFLILNDIGCPEKIFDVVDKSFDDEDLPLSQDALWERNIFGTKSETLDKKFYRQQYNFLVQDLEPGGHVDYGVWEVVPVEPVLKRGQIGNTQAPDRVYAYEHLYTRKKIPGGEDGVDRVHFLLHMRGLASVQHPHLISVFATYTQDDMNCVLLSPPTEMNLKQVFEDQSKQFKLLDKKDRREIVLTWAHCIASALAYLHEHGFVHRDVRPSTVVVDQNSKVYLSDFAALKALDCEDTPNLYSGEVYEHSPPENWLRKPALHETAPLKTYLPGGSRTSRRLPKNPSSKSIDMRPPPSPISSIAQTSNSRSGSSSGSSTTNLRPRNAIITTFAPRRASTTSLTSKQYPQDIFSLSTVLLTLLSYLLGHSPKTFASYRCKLNRQAGRGNAPPDASFHKNLKQVGKWMDTLVKEAGHKEKKDVKFWGAVVELVGVCRKGLGKEPNSRISAVELDKKVGGWVEWGLGRRRRCTCQEQDKALSSTKTSEVDPTEKRPRRQVRPPNARSERISYIHQTPARYWTTVSEDVSDAFPTARNSLATVGLETPRTRGSFATTISPSARASVPSIPSGTNRNSFLRNSVASSTTNGLSGRRRSSASASRRTSNTTEVWGLGEALHEEDEVESLPDPEQTRKHPQYDIVEEYYEGYDVEAGGDGGAYPIDRDDFMLEGVAEEDEGADEQSITSSALTGDHGDESIADDEDTEVESIAARKAWPLPLGKLRFDSAISIASSTVIK